MSYLKRFTSTDSLISDMDGFVPTIKDSILQSRYVGLLAISGVTAYELAIKDIMYDFSDKKHAALGAAARSKFDRINGRIKLESLRKEHIKFFGEKYKKRFEKKLDETKNAYLRAHRADIISSYSNLILWRHEFAHESSIPATYDEVKEAYMHGKQIIQCVKEIMVR